MMSGFYQLLCAAAAATPSALGPELSLYATLSSDYVFRGLSQSDEHASLQLGIEAEFDNGWFVGVWGASTDLTNGGRSREREIDYYLGFLHDVSSRWAIGAAISRYTYPGSGGNVDYDYGEIAVLANFDDRAWLEIRYTDNFRGHRNHARNIELTTEWPLPGKFVMDVVGGYFDRFGDSDSDYAHWQVGLNRPLGRFNLDLRYHDTSRAPSLSSDSGLADPRVVISISTAF